MSIQIEIEELRARLDELEQRTATAGGSGLGIIYVSGSQTINTSDYIVLSGSGATSLSSSDSSNVLIISSTVGLSNPVTSLTISAGPGSAVNRGIFMSGTSYLDAPGITYVNTFPSAGSGWPQVTNTTYKSYSDGTWTPSVATLSGMFGTRNWFSGGSTAGNFVRNGKQVFFEGFWQGAGYNGPAPTTASLYLSLPNIGGGYGIMYCSFWTSISTIYAITARLNAGGYSSIAPLYKVTSTGISPLIGSDFSSTSSLEFAGTIVYSLP